MPIDGLYSEPTHIFLEEKLMNAMVKPQIYKVEGQDPEKLGPRQYIQKENGVGFPSPLSFAEGDFLLAENATYQVQDGKWVRVAGNGSGFRYGHQSHISGGKKVPSRGISE